jgi:formylglycine-generating enzyme required for sulfatase activity
MPTTDKRPLKVFLCHAHADRDPVRGLYTRLTQDGVDAWLDEENLLPGQAWRDVIEESVRTSDIVLVCLSSQSVTKEGFVQKEIKIALDVADEKPEDTIFVIPARLGDCVVPRRLKDLQWVNLFDESGYRRLMLAFNEKSKRIDASFELPKQHSIVMPSDETFIKKVADELDKLSFWGKLVAWFRHFFWPNPKMMIFIALISIVGIIVIRSLDLHPFEKWFVPVLTSTETAMVSTFASTLPPTATHTPAFTLTPSVTPTYTPTFVLPESGYTIVDPADVFKLVAKTDPFGKIAKEQYAPQEINSVDRTLFYTIDGTPDKPMQWRWYWCATTEEILKQNVNGIDVVFQADGRLIPHEQLAFTSYSYPKDTGGTGWCATFSTVIKDWKPGVYHFVIASTIKSVINDGEATFLSGFQISDFTVKIRELALKTEIVDDKGVQMALVQGSSFQMGGGAKVDQQPIHAVYLNSYYIDAYEVSNALYKACVDANVCQPPKDLSSTTHPSYYTDPRFNNYPVVNVNWSEAEAYCQWRDARLPTEAEWEKAARGVGGRTYPWGNLLECTYANYLDVGGTQCFVVGDTTPVDKYNKGVSPFGVYGLVGNVWEWVSDWYSESYYSVSPLVNPQGVDSGQYRVMRGGSWKDDSNNMLPTLRNWYDPESYSNTIGFRCAKDAP